MLEKLGPEPFNCNSFGGGGGGGGGGAGVVGPHMLYLETSRDSISYEFYKLIEVVFKTFE